MSVKTKWTRHQQLVAFNLYCQMPFGKMHYRNPQIIKYAELIGRTPSALAMKLTNIASLDHAITSTGRKGLQNASASDKALWDEMQENWENFAVESQQALSSFTANEEFLNATEDKKLDGAIDYTGNDKLINTKARIGQQFFRRSVLSAYNYKCCITGLAVPKLLVASHIVPWSINQKNRLNPRNGLCLSTLHDKAFDVGMITISHEMTVSVSRRYLDEKDQFFKSALLNYEGKQIILPEKFAPLSEFLKYHRLYIFDTFT